MRDGSIEEEILLRNIGDGIAQFADVDLPYIEVVDGDHASLGGQLGKIGSGPEKIAVCYPYYANTVLFCCINSSVHC